MLSSDCIRELRSSWLPNITDAGLRRLIDLLETGSPLLIHGCFTRVLPMGCLATHAAWHHPLTTHFQQDAGIRWLHGVACLNPATSHVIREWDRCGTHDCETRAAFLAELRAELRKRQTNSSPTEDVAELVEV